MANAPASVGRTRRIRAWMAALIGVVATSIIGYFVTDGMNAVKNAIGAEDSLSVRVTELGSNGGALVNARAADVTARGVPELPWPSPPQNGVWRDVGSYIRIKTFGTVDAPVLIHAIGATNVRCFKPKGPRTFLEVYGGGAFTYYPVAITLANTTGRDWIPGSVIPYNEEQWSFPRQVSKSDAEGYEVSISVPEGQQCEFGLMFDYEEPDGSRRRLVLNASDGKPFVMASSASADEVIGIGH